MLQLLAVLFTAVAKLFFADPPSLPMGKPITLGGI